MRVMLVLAVVLVSSVAVVLAGQDGGGEETQAGVFMVATENLGLYNQPPRRFGPIPFIRFRGEPTGVLSTGAIFVILGRGTRNDPAWFEVAERGGETDGETGWLSPEVEGSWVPIVMDLTSDDLTGAFDAAIDYYTALNRIEAPVPPGALDALTIARNAVP